MPQTVHRRSYRQRRYIRAALDCCVSAHHVTSRMHRCTCDKPTSLSLLCTVHPCSSCHKVNVDLHIVVQAARARASTRQAHLSSLPTLILTSAAASWTALISFTSMAASQKQH